MLLVFAQRLDLTRAFLFEMYIGTLSGAAPGMLPFFQWLAAHHPEYVN